MYEIIRQLSAAVMAVPQLIADVFLGSRQWECHAAA
jgi:hypothetical protein